MRVLYPREAEIAPSGHGLPSFACTYVHRLDGPLVRRRFGLLDHLLLGSRRTSISRLEDIVGQVETGSRLKMYKINPNSDLLANMRYRQVIDTWLEPRP